MLYPTELTTQKKWTRWSDLNRRVMTQTDLQTVAFDLLATSWEIEWRKRRDSNSRAALLRPSVFETAPINRALARFQFLAEEKRFELLCRIATTIAFPRRAHSPLGHSS